MYKCKKKKKRSNLCKYCKISLLAASDIQNAESASGREKKMTLRDSKSKEIHMQSKVLSDKSTWIYTKLERDKQGDSKMITTYSIIITSRLYVHCIVSS